MLNRAIVANPGGMVKLWISLKSRSSVFSLRRVDGRERFVNWLLAMPAMVRLVRSVGKVRPVSAFCERSRVASLVNPDGKVICASRLFSRNRVVRFVDRESVV